MEITGDLNDKEFDENDSRGPMKHRVTHRFKRTLEFDGEVENNSIFESTNKKQETKQIPIFPWEMSFY
jgi:hypothetical protein